MDQTWMQSDFSPPRLGTNREKSGIRMIFQARGYIDIMVMMVVGKHGDDDSDGEGDVDSNGGGDVGDVIHGGGGDDDVDLER